MKWIKDRNPQSSGLYGTIISMRNNSGPENFFIAYFDGKGWLLPNQTGEFLGPYRFNLFAWCVLDIGKD